MFQLLGTVPYKRGYQQFVITAYKKETSSVRYRTDNGTNFIEVRNELKIEIQRSLQWRPNYYGRNIIQIDIMFECSLQYHTKHYGRNIIPKQIMAYNKPI